MNLHWSALTMASHVAIIMAIFCCFVNAILVRRHWVSDDGISIFRRLEDPIFGIAAALVVERLFYVGARLLVNTEVDLWEAHPVPEVLSAMVAGCIMWLAINIRLMGQPKSKHKWTAPALQTGVVITIFGIIAGTTW